MWNNMISAEYGGRFSKNIQNYDYFIKFATFLFVNVIYHTIYIN